MQIKIVGEQPFQVLGTNFTIGPSESGYDLMFSANGVEYSKLFTVGANTNRQVTQVAAGSYYFLSGNTDTVTVNWMKDCGGGSGGGSYVLPVASENTLGGVKIGSGITIDENGAISAEGGGGSYVLPTASSEVLGGVKIGSGITVDSAGTISVEAQSGGTNDYYVGWDDLYDMDYAPRRAAFAEIVEKYNAGYHIYASGTTAASNGYDVILPLVEFIPGTWSTDRYVGGWAKFAAINSSGSTSGYYAATFNSSGNIAPNAKYFSKSDFYTLQNATVSRLGGVKVGSGLTMDGNDKLNVAIGAGLAFSGDTIVVSGGTGGGGEDIYVINDIIAEQSSAATFYALMKDAISGATAPGWDFKVFYRYKFFGMNDTLVPMQTAWINDYNSFGNENVILVFRSCGYASLCGSIPDEIRVEIADDGSASENSCGGQEMPGVTNITIDITSAGTFNDYNQLFIFGEQDGALTNKVVAKCGEDNDAWGMAPIKYVYREFVGDDLIYHLCVEVPNGGTLYRGTWHWNDQDREHYTTDSWAAV